MRTIKFRGKTIRSKEWVYSSTISQGTIKRKANKWFMEISENVWKGLQEGSLGQFTGLYDKDGKEIYEGDIILEKLKRSRKGGDLYEIVFEDCQWLGKNKDGAITSLSLLNDFHVIKIIGNIHDNPELLK